MPSFTTFHLCDIAGAAAVLEFALELVRHAVERLDVALRVAQHSNTPGYRFRFGRSEIGRHLPDRRQKRGKQIDRF